MIFKGFTINLGGRCIDLSQPIVMGILNLTPDSFYDGGQHFNRDNALIHIEKMLEEGATIIDVGGVSTRPNAPFVSSEEEQNRVLPVIAEAVKKFPNINISIDTCKSEIAYAAVNEGAVMVNDVYGGDQDKNMYETIAQLKVPYILMHSRGDSHTMMKLNNYQDLFDEIFVYFEKKISELMMLGLKDVCIDPGFGFAKNTTQNYILLKKLPYFKSLNVPILIGLSRKSMIYKTLNISEKEALNGTTIVNTLGILGGANILRVHDVKEAMEVIKICKDF